ncbi:MULTISPECIES: carbohydrate ABC transporter permease [unclassified Microbacterium]|uniref:carbohydrate ABC transporter permease n=1 Tax=unclassified Microbacterium TaxID=2609290 RepID=UPI003667F211
MLNLVVIGAPAISNLYYAFTDWSGIGDAHFNGLDNAVRLFQDQSFWNALGHNFIYMAFFLTVPIIMGLYGAFALSRVRRGRTFFRVAFFIPYLIASVVNAAIWKNILDPQAGLAAALNKIGIHWLDNVYFLGDPHLALGSVMFVDNWHFWGFLVVLFLAATTSIDGARYEAARIDGANAWQEFWHVTLPGIRPTLVFGLTIIALWSLLAFDYSYALTGGGPAGASDLVALLVNRTAFGANEAGYAAFMGLITSILGGVLLLVIGLLRRKEEDES